MPHIWPPSGGEELQIQLDKSGEIKKISLDSIADGTYATAQDVADAINNLLKAEFGVMPNSPTDGMVRLVFNADPSVNSFEFIAGDGANMLTVYADCDPLGLNDRDSNKWLTTDELRNIDLFSGLVTGPFTFKINGVQITLKEDVNLYELMNAINTSAANVNVSYDTTNDTFVFTSKVSGSSTQLTFEDVQGNLLNTWLGIDGSGSVLMSGNSTELDPEYDNVIFDDANFIIGTGSNEDLINAFHSVLYPGPATMNYSLDVTINGVKKTLSFSLTDTDYANLFPSGFDDTNISANTEANINRMAANIRTAINRGLSASLAAEFPDEVGNVALGIQANNAFAFEIVDGCSQVTISQDPLPGTNVDLFNLFNLNHAGDTSHSNYDTTLAGITDLSDIDGLDLAAVSPEFTVTLGGVTRSINYDPNTDTILDLVDAINAAFRAPVGNTQRDIAFIKDGKLVLDTGGERLAFQDVSGNFCEVMFGVSSYDSAPKSMKALDEPGLNGEIVLGNGQSVYSTTNTFEVNGITFTIDKEFEIDVTDPAYTTDQNVKIVVTADNDAIADGLEDFILQYNAIISLLTGTYTEKKNSDYAPLTDEQKSELTTDEIEKWETEAKKGILYNDPYLRDIVSQMRTVIYGEVNSNGMAAYTIGITTMPMGSTTSDGETTITLANSGLLELDREVLIAALELNPDGVRELFTDKENGLISHLNTVMTNAVSTSSVSQGTLVWVAGTEDTTYESVIGNKLLKIDDLISRLKTKLETEYNRYWKQFTNLELALQQLNTQSGWLQDFGA